MTKKQIQEWHEEGVGLASTYLKCEARMVELLGLIANARGYLYFQCPSLRQYAISKWELPEYTAADMVTVARKSLEIPELLSALQRGQTSLSKLRRICSVITPADKTEWLDLAEKGTNREIEKAVAAARPQPVDESLNYKDEGLSELRVGLNEETRKNLERIRDLLSQKKGRAVTLSECLEQMTKIVLEKIDPIKKAERAMKRSTVKREKLGTCQVRRFTRPRRKLPARVEHAVNLRDQVQCAHVDHQGRRCPNRRWLHRHHLKPVSMGGDDSAENLTSLCSGHHRLVHFQEKEILP